MFEENEDGTGKINFANRARFDVVVQCIAAGSSHRSTVKMFDIFGRALNNMSLRVPTESTVRHYVRFVLAIYLSAMKELLERTWGFSVMVDGATHKGRGYLDVRLSFAVAGRIRNFHLLAIPTGERSHTGENYAKLVIETLQFLVGPQILLK